MKYIWPLTVAPLEHIILISAKPVFVLTL